MTTHTIVHDMYKPAVLLDDAQISACPCCGAAAELWQFSETATSPCLKVVMCSTSEGIGPQDGITNEGCPLYMPNSDFYRPTQREAIKYWNTFASAIRELQHKNAAPAGETEGWKLVPIEPTDAMRAAGGHVNSEWLNDNAPIGEARYVAPMIGVYRAMLAAAPEGPEGSPT